MKTGSYRFSQIAIVIMSIVFILNLILSRDYNVFWIVLSGGGKIMDYLGASYKTVVEEFQLYRLVTYGYTQPAIWHLIANVFALWYVGMYLTKKMGSFKFVLVFHLGLIAAGISMIMIFQSSFNYGASPAIFACIGVLIHWVIRKRELWSEYKVQKGFHFLFWYFIVSNFLSVGTAVFHLLGFCTGFILGFVIRDREV